MSNGQFNEIKVFLSCPEDVIKEGDFLNIIEETIDYYNQFLPTATGMRRLQLTHWKKNKFLGRGKPRVQDRINFRLVDSCDIFIGILWTRFGSPPGITVNGLNFESGTEEEFDRARKIVKDLWIFFCDCPINPSKIDVTQLEKVRKFKNILENEQIEYAEFSSLEEFKKQIKSHLSEFGKEIYILKAKKIKIPKEGIKISREEFRKLNRGF